MERIKKLTSIVLMLTIVFSTVFTLSDFEVEAATADVALTAENFPDEEFRKYIQAFDTNGDKVLQVDELNAVKKIAIASDSKVKDITGVKYFTEITELRVENKLVTKVNLDRINTKLTKIVIKESGVTSLTLGYRSKLKVLSCYDAPLKSLNVLGCPNLYYLDIGANCPITSIDISFCPLILETMENGKYAEFTYSNSYTLDVNGTNHYFRISVANLKNIITTHPEGSIPLTTQFFKDFRLRNYLKPYDIDSNGYLNPTELSSVKSIIIKENDSSYVNIANLAGIEYLPELKTIECENSTKLKTVNVSSNPKLEILMIPNSLVEELDLSNNKNLKRLDLNNVSGIIEIDVSGCPNLSYLDLTNTGVTMVDISNNPILVNLVKNTTVCYSDVETHNIDMYGRSDSTEFLAINHNGNVVTPASQQEPSNPTSAPVSGGETPTNAPTNYYNGAIPTDAPTPEPLYEVGVFVERCYRITMDRQPDAESYDQWVWMLKNGKICAAQVAYSFLYSQEYIEKDTDNKDYILELYDLFFGRTPSGNELNDWYAVLAQQQQTREEVFFAFANSIEFQNLCKQYGVPAGSYILGLPNSLQIGTNCFVSRLYRICLSREPDIESQIGWVQKLVSGEVSGTQISYGFIFSPEFVNRNLSNEEYVAYLYRAFFGREPDLDGFNGWVNDLYSGVKTREEVFSGFTGSAEFYNLCAEYGINP